MDQTVSSDDRPSPNGFMEPGATAVEDVAEPYCEGLHSARSSPATLGYDKVRAATAAQVVFKQVWDKAGSLPKARLVKSGPGRASRSSAASRSAATAASSSVLMHEQQQQDELGPGPGPGSGLEHGGRLWSGHGHQYEPSQQRRRELELLYKVHEIQHKTIDKSQQKQRRLYGRGRRVKAEKGKDNVDDNDNGNDEEEEEEKDGMAMMIEQTPPSLPVLPLPPPSPPSSCPTPCLPPILRPRRSRRLHFEQHDQHDQHRAASSPHSNPSLNASRSTMAMKSLSSNNNNNKRSSSTLSGLSAPATEAAIGPEAAIAETAELEDECEEDGEERAADQASAPDMENSATARTRALSTRTSRISRTGMVIPATAAATTEAEAATARTLTTTMTTTTTTSSGARARTRAQAQARATTYRGTNILFQTPAGSGSGSGPKCLHKKHKKSPLQQHHHQQQQQQQQQRQQQNKQKQPKKPVAPVPLSSSSLWTAAVHDMSPRLTTVAPIAEAEAPVATARTAEESMTGPLTIHTHTSLKFGEREVLSRRRGHEDETEDMSEQEQEEEEDDDDDGSTGIDKSEAVVSMTTGSGDEDTTTTTTARERQGQLKGSSTIVQVAGIRPTTTCSSEPFFPPPRKPFKESTGSRTTTTTSTLRTDRGGYGDTMKRPAVEAHEARWPFQNYDSSSSNLHYSATRTRDEHMVCPDTSSMEAFTRWSFPSSSPPPSSTTIVPLATDTSTSTTTTPFPPAAQPVAASAAASARRFRRQEHGQGQGKEGQGVSRRSSLHHGHRQRRRRWRQRQYGFMAPLLPESNAEATLYRHYPSNTTFQQWMRRMAPAQKAARSVYRMISRILRRGLDQSLLGWLYRRYQQQFDYGHDVYLAAVPFPGHGHGMTEADTPAKHQVVYGKKAYADYSKFVRWVRWYRGYSAEQERRWRRQKQRTLVGRIHLMVQRTLWPRHGRRHPWRGVWNLLAKVSPLIHEMASRFPEESTEAMERRLFEEETRKGYIGDNDDDDLDYDGDDDLGDDHDDDEEDSDSDSFDESDQDSEPGSTGTLTEAPFDYSLLQRRMGLHFQEPSPIPSQRRRSLSQPAGREDDGHVGVEGSRTGTRTWTTTTRRTAEQGRWRRSTKRTD